jgi:chorismate mutase
MSDIPRLMAEIDKLDADMVGLLVRRFDRSREIGRLKRAGGQAAVDPQRVEAQRSCFVQLCARVGLDATMAAALISVITERVIAEKADESS